MTLPDDVLTFWFEELAPEQHWVKSPALDAQIRERFLSTYQAIATDACEDWLDAPKSALAYIIVLDQFARNMFRDTSRMYAEDARAQHAVRHAIDRGFDRELSQDERCFLYMPLMHSENIADQERCCELFEGSGFAEYAVRHRDIVAKWGRFPHRNEILGRDCTPEEVEFLKTPGSSF